MFPTSAAKTALVRSGLVSIQAPSFDAECVEMSRFVGGSRLPRPPLRIGGRGACCACIPWFACAQNSLAASAARSLRAAAAAALAASVEPLPLEGRRADEALCGLEGGAPPLVGVDIASWVLRPLALIVG